MPRLFIACCVCMVAASCRNSQELKNNAAVGVQDSVTAMTRAIEKDVSAKGPAAWLKYFEKTNDFYMASDGRLVFPNYDSAKNTILGNLVKNITSIRLQWRNIRIEESGSAFANIAASFHEDITTVSGGPMPVDGYFTATAHQTTDGWKLRNAHWSIVHK